MIAESKAGLDAAAAGLGLLSELIKVAREARPGEKHPLAMNEIILQLPAAAHRVAGDFVRELQKLKQDMVNANINESATLDQLQSDTAFWRLKKWRVLRDFKPRVYALQSALGNFFDDLVAIANCKDADAVLARSYEQSLGQKRELEALVARDRPVGRIVNDLISVAQARQAELADLIK